MRRVFVKIELTLVLDMEEGVEMSDVLSELKICSDHDQADVVDYDIVRAEVTDSK